MNISQNYELFENILAEISLFVNILVIFSDLFTLSKIRSILIDYKVLDIAKKYTGFHQNLMFQKKLNSSCTNIFFLRE